MRLFQLQVICDAIKLTKRKTGAGERKRDRATEDNCGRWLFNGYYMNCFPYVVSKILKVTQQSISVLSVSYLFPTFLHTSFSKSQILPPSDQHAFPLFLSSTLYAYISPPAAFLVKRNYD